MFSVIYIHGRLIDHTAISAQDRVLGLRSERMCM
jgi:hypothetical protein